MSGEYKRGNGGRFSGDVSDQDILIVFDKLDADGPLTTREVAEELPIGRRATHEHLQRMHEDGQLGKKNMGNRVVWWAELAPELKPEIEAELERRSEEEEFTPLSEV